MANVFLDLPLPAGNGGGAPIDTSSLGREKTVTIQGTFTDPNTGKGPSISVQVSMDGVVWAGIFNWSAPAKKKFEVAARFMRTFVQDFDPLIPMAANVDVAADDIGALFAVLPVTPVAGIGAVINTSLLGTFKTVVVEGNFSGSVHIDISEDGIDWAECFTFTRPGALKSKEFTAQFMRTRRSGVDLQVPGSATASVGGINDATAGGGAAGAGVGASLMYQPGGGAIGPAVFSDWNALYAQLLVLRAASVGDLPVRVAIDDNFVTPAVIPAGVFDMSNVRLVPAIDPPASGITFLHLSEGTFLPNLRHIGDGSATLIVRNAATTTVPISISGAYEAFYNQGAFIECLAGATPMIDVTGMGPGGFLFVATSDFGGWGQNPGGGRPVIDMNVAGTTLFTNSTNGGYWRNSISGVAGAAAIHQGGTKLWQLQEQPNFLGSESVFNLSGLLGPSREMGPNVGNSFTNPAVAAVGNLRNRDAINYYDVSGGAIVQSLKTIGNLSDGKSAGNQMTFVEVSGNAGLSLVAPAGQTLNGVVAGSFNVPAGGSVLISNDGVDAYNVMGVYDPADAAADGQVVYQPFTPAAGPVAFDSWPALMTQLTLMKAANNGTGQYTISFRDAGAAPFTPMFIPAGGPYPMEGVTWDGRLSPRGANTHISDGATFTGLRTFTDGMFVRNLNTVTPADDSIGSGAGGIGSASVEVRRSCDIAGNAGGAPMWGSGNLLPGDFILCRVETNSNLGNNSPGTIFSVPDGVSLILVADYGEPLEPTRSDLLVGTAGAVLLQRYPGSFSVKKSNPLWLGTNLHFYIQPSSLQPNPYRLAPAVAPVSASWGQAVRLDASGGAIVQPLASISGSVTGSPGGQISIVETSGTAGVTVTPGAGDTINGAVTPIAVPAGGGVLLQSDGVSNWDLVASHNPADDASSSNALIYRPGSGLAGPVIFDTWLALMNQLELMRVVSNDGGKYTVQVDDQVVSPAVIPVAAPVAGAPTAAFTGPVGSTMTLTDGGATFTFSPDGRFVTIAGATSPANDGVFPVTGVPSPTTVEYTNAAGVAEAAGGADQRRPVLPGRSARDNPLCRRSHLSRASTYFRNTVSLRSVDGDVASTKHRLWCWL
jgi:hypothetical protein